jgi:hypothetical protein
MEMMDRSLEIQGWLSQFNSYDIFTAKSLLSHLLFISRDDYSQWLIDKLDSYTSTLCAVYAVRKFSKQAKCLWKSNGSVQPRPAQTQGSEDLVASVIANANRQYNNCFIDHPSLQMLREKKIHHIILIDDSIGSGKRIADFIDLMINNKTFLSWWSYGFITISIISYARTIQSEKYILGRLVGSDHGIREHRKSDKLKFDCNIVYDALDISYRWGSNSQEVLSLCNNNRKIVKDRRKGFGGVMGNLIFYHSVPNNIPGMLYSTSRSWKPLFPNRSLPEWMPRLLEKSDSQQGNNENGVGYKIHISNEVIFLLQNIKKGIRTKASLSRRMDCDIDITQDLINQALKAGFITEQLRLTKTGFNFLYKQNSKPYILKPNYSLYIPKSWCAGQRTVQPPAFDANKALVRADSIDFEFIDGDGGESSLERTDAKATMSPINSEPQHPSMSRKRSTIHGPEGLKE